MCYSLAAKAGGRKVEGLANWMLQLVELPLDTFSLFVAAANATAATLCSHAATEQHFMTLLSLWVKNKFDEVVMVVVVVVAIAVVVIVTLVAAVAAFESGNARKR